MAPISGISVLKASLDRPLLQGGQDARHVGLGDQHLPGLRALVAGDHAAALQHVDHPARARVAEAQTPLQHRGRGRLHFGDQRDRVLEQRILVGVEVIRPPLPLLRRRLDLLQQLLAQLGLALLAPEVRQLRDLWLVDVRALNALQARGADRAEQHVALPQQRLGAVLVEDHARVGLRAHREGDPGGDVGLDHARDHIHARALCRQHEVDADGARLLREADDRVLDVCGRDHHQVGELVDHAQDVRQRRLAPRFARLVELRQAARARQRHRAVALLHLSDKVLQRVGGHPRAGDHGGEEMGDRLVVVELDLLGVDQHEAQFVRAGAQQDAREHRVDRARLAGAGRARHKQVGHLREVGPDRLARDVLAEPHCQRRPVLRGLLVDVAEAHDLAAGVGDLDPDRLLARDRREDADVGRCQGVREVVLQLWHLRDLRPRRQA